MCVSSSACNAAAATAIPGGADRVARRAQVNARRSARRRADPPQGEAGDRGVGLSSEVWWSPNHPFKSGLTGESVKAYCDAFTAATGKQWVQPLGFKHALLEVAMDVLKRTKNVSDPKSILAAITETDYQSIVGPISWKGGGPRNPVKNVCTTPLVGGQWVKGDKFKYEIVNVDNRSAPNVPTVGKMIPIPYAS